MRPSSPIKQAATIFTAALGLAICANAISATKEQQKMLDNVSTEGFMAMRDIRLARVAIFSGHINAATSFVEAARQNLAKAGKEAGKATLTLKVKERPGAKGEKQKSTEVGDLISIDAATMLTEDFAVTPEKKETVAKANEHLKKGDVGKAVATLKAADIGVSVVHTLIPVKATQEHVDKAIGLLKAHKYYEANLALKAAEDGEIVDAAIAYEPPKAKAATKKAIGPGKKSESASHAEPATKSQSAQK
jgi:hypothetical protein